MPGCRERPRAPREVWLCVPALALAPGHTHVGIPTLQGGGNLKGEVPGRWEVYGMVRSGTVGVGQRVSSPCGV